MPLSTMPDSIDSSSLVDMNVDYLIFYSSLDHTKQMWCPVSPAVSFHRFNTACQKAALT